jgi:hypothetical protein
VCDGLKVQTLSDFEKLNDCQIVEGSVEIYGRNLSSGDLKNVSYPQLMEVAGFLMIYQVPELKSISQLFPHLVAIRGGQLFKSYSLIIYENPDLENIGLNHLKTITNGAVIVERNSKLCYVNTVDWSVILNNDTYGKNIFEVSCFL